MKNGTIVILGLLLMIGCASCRNGSDTNNGATVPRETIRSRLLEFQKEISAAATASEQVKHINGLYEYLVEQQDKFVSQQEGPAFSWTIEVLDLGTSENVTTRAWQETDREIKAELRVGTNESGRYEPLVTIEIKPMDKSSLLVFFRE